VQGQLRTEPVEITIETSCGHCGARLTMTVDSGSNAVVDQDDADPLVFLPQIDWAAIKQPPIIDAY
jgi:hypothetical protein